jgi:DNA polymerase-3 subunit beta
MELKIAVQDLSKALQRVQGVVEKKTTMPILANVLLEAHADGRMTVSATNLEIGITGAYPAEVQKAGAITLAGKALFDIVRSLPEETVRLVRTANNWVEITCGKVSFRMVGMASDGYPALPEFGDVDMFGIDRGALREMIDKTLYSVCTDETRYNLTGVYLEPMSGDGGPGLRMVSTDGHRLSVIERPLQSAPSIKKGLTIPRKGIVEMRRLLDDGEAEAKLGFIDNSAVFQKDGLTLTMQLIEGQFPDYKQVIPSGHTKSLRVGRQALLTALKRTSLLSPDKAQGVRLDMSGSTLALSANNPDLGEAREELDVELDGDALKIGFNFKYLTEVLNVLTEDRVELQLSDALSPGVLVGEGSEGFRAIVMPMRL